MAKHTTAGARHLRVRPEKEEVCTSHHKTESKLTRLPSGAVKRQK